nr:GAF domain-containing protein [candidate division Zixibacteria bacterium]
MEADNIVPGEPISRFWSKINLMAEIAAVFRNAPADRAAYVRVLELIQQIIPFEAAVLCLLADHSEAGFEITSFGRKLDLSFYEEYIGEKNFLHWAGRQKTPVVLNTAHRDSSRHLQNEAVLVLPLIIKDRSIGIMIMVDGTRNSFRDKDIKLLTVLSYQIALSAERQIYLKELEQKNAELIIAHQHLQEAHEQLIGIEKLNAVRELAASVNHEVNNPLSVITGNVEYLLYINKGLNDNIINRLKIIQGEANRIAEINRRLLDIQDLVSEPYIPEDANVRMLNLEKSTSGVKK